MVVWSKFKGLSSLNRRTNREDKIIYYGVVSLPHHASDICNTLCWQAYWHNGWVERDRVWQFDQSNVIVVVYTVGVVVFRVNVDWGSEQRRAQQGSNIRESHVSLQINSTGENTFKIQKNLSKGHADSIYSSQLTRTDSFGATFPSCTRTWAAVIIQWSAITMPPALCPSTLSNTCQGMVFSGASLPPMILW